MEATPAVFFCPVAISLTRPGGFSESEQTVIGVLLVSALISKRDTNIIIALLSNGYITEQLFKDRNSVVTCDKKNLTTACG